MLEYPVAFTSENESHAHALETLELLSIYESFMRSIDTMVDLGCGTGKDLEWWATRSILDDDDQEIPLDITCTGIDLAPELSVTQHYLNIDYIQHDFEKKPKQTECYDVAWCHNAFQYALNPLNTLRNFYDMLTPGGMLALIVPQTTNVVYHVEAFDQYNGQYFNHTLVSLIHMLAVSGFDCKAGFFRKNLDDPWLHAVVYKSDYEPLDPRITTWVDLVEMELLPDSADASIGQCGYVRQQDLVLPWLDRTVRSYKQF